MMRILHIAPLTSVIGPWVTGGAQSFVHALAQLQRVRGHEVSLICCSGSQLHPSLSFIDLGLKEGTLFVKGSDGKEREEDGCFFYPIARYLKEKGENYDVIHNHSYDHWLIENLGQFALPTVHTLHLPPLFSEMNRALKAIDRSKNKLITVSQTMRRGYEEQAIETTAILNGTMSRELAAGGEHCLWAGRISREKGLHIAVRWICDWMGDDLLVAGRIEEEEYFQKFALLPSVKYLGWLTHSSLQKLFGEVKALVFPPLWDEPFGLTAIEAMMCGTPVIATKKGALAEIIEEGVTGYFVNDRASLKEIFHQLNTFDRNRCRDAAMSRYLLDETARLYDAIAYSC